MQNIFNILLPLVVVFSTVNTVGALIICLPRRYSLPITIVAFAIFLATPLMISYFVGFMIRLPVPNSWMNIPLALFLFRAHVFQTLFLLFSQAFITLAVVLFSIMALNFFVPCGCGEYFLIILVLICLVFITYTVLTLRFGKPLLKKIFDGGTKAEWALYSMSALAAHVFVFVLWGLREQSTLLHFGVLVSLMWSFAILCYAIINTHDRTKKQFEASYAKEIIASGEEHYQKMNELFEKLRIMRHDFKYHQNVLLDYMQRGETDKAIEYLKGQRAEALQHELMHFCSNQVINALLVWYAGRYEKHGIDYSFKIALPEKLPVSDYDMCIVIGNLLENALEASLQLADNRKIDLDIILRKGQIALKIRNNFKPPMEKQKAAMGNDTNVSPTLSEGRGLGLRSVQIVTERYKGKLSIGRLGNAFIVTVLMGIAL